MRKPSKLILALCLCLPMAGYAKGSGVGFWMEGTVKNIRVNADKINFQLIGRFWFIQYSGQPATKESLITVDLSHGTTVTIRQATPFFAMSSDWRGGAIRKKGELLKILQAAARHNRKVKFQLTQPQLAFGPNQTFSLMNAAVIRATDADLN